MFFYEVLISVVCRFSSSVFIIKVLKLSFFIIKNAPSYGFTVKYVCVFIYITHAQTKLLDILLALCSVHSTSTLFTTFYILLFHYFKIKVSNKKQTEHLVLDVPFMTSDSFFEAAAPQGFLESSRNAQQPSGSCSLWLLRASRAAVVAELLVGHQTIGDGQQV